MVTEEQLGFFARNGFLHLENMVPSQICESLVEKTWARLPPEWDRGDMGSWQGMVPDSCHSASIDVRRGHLKFQRGDLLSDPAVDAGFFPRTRLGAVAGELIGAPLAPIRIRGLYCIVPLPDEVICSTPQTPHIEAHPTQLVCLCYLEDVLPGGGGLLVWPGSHRAIYPTMSSRLEFAATPKHTGVCAKWAAKEPIEIPGRRGDVVIIHHRLLHAPSINRSKSIRFGFLCDYHRKDFRELFARPPKEDMWEDWPAIRQLPQRVTAAPPDYRLKQRRGPSPLQALFSSVAKFSFLRVKKGPKHPSPESADYIRQNDASMLARSRFPEDVWIALSDHPSTFKETKLRPRGSTWNNTELKIKFDGSPIESVCYYDFIANVGRGEGKHEVSVSGLQREAWIRVIRIKLPLDESEVLLRQRLQPGNWRLKIPAKNGSNPESS